MMTFYRGFRTFSVLSLVTAGMSIVGCGLLKKGGDAADAEAEAAVAEVAEAAPPPVVLPTAANENDVSRFPDEKKLENVTATLLRPAQVRELPGPSGKVVAPLAKGGTVTQIAQRATFFLVVFQNPADSKTLMGWVSQDAFSAAPVVPPTVLKCTAPESALSSGDASFCGKICSADTDCVAGQACKGAANKLLANGAKGDPVTVCTVFGAPKVAVADASVPPAATIPPVVILPVPVPTVDVADPVGTRCAVGFTLVAKDNKCHKNGCTIGRGCRPGTSFCIPCAGVLVCSANKDLCK